MVKNKSEGGEGGERNSRSALDPDKGISSSGVVWREVMENLGEVISLTGGDRQMMEDCK